ncbi:MAG TPA: TetR/AcrR family transcriptional regulator [Steroidobacteraceae bacterium]|nr:TetR/AcrR family transcriptional regulator [Steroidobacteraceae bacterium]
MSHRDSTRNRILSTSLELFNASGIGKTSLNRIAAELDISSGNLHYHFKTKEQIADVLIRRFQDRIETIIAPSATITALDDLWLVLHLALETFEEYRFIYRDVDFLVRESARIAQRLQLITVHCVAAAHQMCSALAKASVIRAKPEEVDDLAVQMVLTATCWYTFARLWQAGQPEGHTAGRAAYHVLTLLTPYLADNARLYMTYLRSKYLG